MTTRDGQTERTLRTKREQFLTAQEVMDRLMADPTVCESGLTCELRAVRSGSEWLFAKRELDAWIKRCRRATAEVASDRSPRKPRRQPQKT